MTSYHLEEIDAAWNKFPPGTEVYVCVGELGTIPAKVLSTPYFVDGHAWELFVMVEWQDRFSQSCTVRASRLCLREMVI